MTMRLFLNDTIIRRFCLHFSGRYDIIIKWDIIPKKLHEKRIL